MIFEVHKIYNSIACGAVPPEPLLCRYTTEFSPLSQKILDPPLAVHTSPQKLPLLIFTTILVGIGGRPFLNKYNQLPLIVGFWSNPWI